MTRELGLKPKKFGGLAQHEAGALEAASVRVYRGAVLQIQRGSTHTLRTAAYLLYGLHLCRLVVFSGTRRAGRPIRITRSL